MRLAEGVSTCGVMGKCMLENGCAIRCKVKAILNGVTGKNTKGILRMIKDMVMEYSNGEMEGCTMVNGKMGNSMGGVCIDKLMGLSLLGNGLMDKG